MASEERNYNRNKSFGCPIQAVFWLEWATILPNPFVIPSEADLSRRAVE